MDADVPSDGNLPDYRRYGRRLSDKLLVAFDQACETRELEIAIQLLTLLERLAEKEAAASEPMRRKAIEGLVAAHERLWTLRNRPLVSPPSGASIG
jgi:hypothetical protein